MKAVSFFLSAIFLLFSVFLKAQYYVSLSGSDDNPGTQEFPFRTIQKAADLMVAGDVCYIMAGIYRETVTPAGNGAPGNPVVFTPYQTDRVVIVGSDTVTGWELWQNNIYKAYFPDSVTQLFVNGKRAYPARYPDFITGNVYSTADWREVNASADGDAVFAAMDFPENYWTGGYCVILTGKKWIAHIGKISSSNGNSVHCDEGWGEFFNGKTDEIRIYKKSLTAGEIHELYDGTTGFFRGRKEIENTIRIYPNPGTSVFRITSPEGKPVSAEVYNEQGEMIVSKTYANEVDLSPFVPGLYFFKISDKNHRVLSMSKTVKR